MAKAKPDEIALAEKRLALRRALKQEYVKKAFNPNAQGLVFDAGVYRFNALHTTTTERFKPNWYNFGRWLCTSILPVAIVMVVIHKSIAKKEQRIRNGEIKYRDRDFKLQG